MSLSSSWSFLRLRPCSSKTMNSFRHLVELIAWLIDPTQSLYLQRKAHRFHASSRIRIYDPCLSGQHPRLRAASILILSSHLRLGIESGFSLPGIQLNLCRVCISHPSPPCVLPAQLILLDLITLLISGEVYRLWSLSAKFSYLTLIYAPYKTDVWRWLPCGMLRRVVW
jgi:hypothetical protein